MWQARKEAAASHVFARPTLLGPFVWVWPHLRHGSLCDRQPQKMRYRLRQHGAYFEPIYACFEPIYACIHTRSISSCLWKLCAEKSGQGLRRNSVITCSRTLKDKVFSSAPRTLPELRIKESCAQVTRGMLTSVVQNFVLRLQAVRESQGTHIKHVIHNATHMWNSNPCLLLWHCFRINKFAIANTLLSWNWQ